MHKSLLIQCYKCLIPMTSEVTSPLTQLNCTSKGSTIYQLEKYCLLNQNLLPHNKKDVEAANTSRPFFSLELWSLFTQALIEMSIYSMVCSAILLGFYNRKRLKWMETQLSTGAIEDCKNNWKENGTQSQNKLKSFNALEKIHH